MSARANTLGAAAAKAKFLSLLDEVEAKRKPYIVTKNGRPVAQIVPMPIEDEDPIFGFYKGKLEIKGDVMKPRYTEKELESFRKREASHLR